MTTVEQAIDSTLLELPPAGANRTGRALLDRVAQVHRSSATVLRYHGRETEARKAEQAALRINLALDESKATGSMFAAVRAVREARDDDRLLEFVLAGAMSLLGADFGNIQLRDARDGSLRIAAQDGFNADFLEHFAVVADDGSACGRAAGKRAQVVIGDVDQDEGFAPHRQIAAASGFRAVQSTPLVDRTGRVVGVVSTHFRRPHRPSPRDLMLMEWYVEQIGDAVRRDGK